MGSWQVINTEEVEESSNLGSKDINSREWPTPVWNGFYFDFQEESIFPEHIHVGIDLAGTKYHFDIEEDNKENKYSQLGNILNNI